jgi:hypothetical protein
MQPSSGGGCVRLGHTLSTIIEHCTSGGKEVAFDEAAKQWRDAARISWVENKRDVTKGNCAAVAIACSHHILHSYGPSEIELSETCSDYHL